MSPEQRIAVLEQALEMVLMYHSASPWDEAKSKRWRRATGRDDATTKALCDHIRCVLALEAKP